MSLGKKQAFLQQFQKTFEHQCNKVAHHGIYGFIEDPPLEEALNLQRKTRVLGHIRELHRIRRRIGNDEAYRELVDMVSRQSPISPDDTQLDDYLHAISTSKGRPLSSRDCAVLKEFRKDVGPIVFRADVDAARLGDPKKYAALQYLFREKLKREPFETYLFRDRTYQVLLHCQKQLGGFEQLKHATTNFGYDAVKQLKAIDGISLADDECQAIYKLQSLGRQNCIATGENLLTIAFRNLEREHNATVAAAAQEAEEEAAHEARNAFLLKNTIKAAEKMSGTTKWLVGGIAAAATVALGSIIYMSKKSHVHREQERRQPREEQPGIAH
jgi:hypothetical protein